MVVMEHVQRLTTAALTDHDSFGAHAKGVDDQALDGDLAFAVDVLGTGLQAANVLLVQLQLGCIFDGDDAVLDRYEAGQHVQKRGLPGAGATRDDDVGLGQHGRLQEAEAGLVAAAEPDQVFDLEGIPGELADGEERTVQSQRPDHRVDAGAVGESCIAKRLALVNAAADRAHDELDHIEELVLVDELYVREDDLAAHFDVDMVASVDHDLGHAVVADQWLDRPELLVVLIDVDAWDPNCHSSASAL